MAKVGVIGSGAVGDALAASFKKHGHDVVRGTREPRELASCFPEFRTLIGECRFQDCRHVSEPGCRIQEAVAAGAIAPDRLESYRMLLEETEAEPEEWE